MSIMSVLRNDSYIPIVMIIVTIIKDMKWSVYFTTSDCLIIPKESTT